MYAVTLRSAHAYGGDFLNTMAYKKKQPKLNHALNVGCLYITSGQVTLCMNDFLGEWATNMASYYALQVMLVPAHAITVVLLVTSKYFCPTTWDKDSRIHVSIGVHSYSFDG